MASEAKGCYACLKYLLFFFNAVFWITGLALLGLGIYAEVESRDKVADVINENERTVARLLIAVGAVTALVGFTGCCGALKEHRGCLLFYATMVAILFILECVAGGLAYRYRDKLETTVEDGMHDTQKKYSSDTDSHVDKAWDYVQTHFKCCGVRKPSDWFVKTAWADRHVDTYPASCCGSSNKGVVCRDNSETFYSIGCYDKVYNELRDHWQVLAGVAVGVAVLQIFGIVFACGLQRHIHNVPYQYV